MAPFGQVSLRFVGSYCGRCCGGPIASRPLSPSTMTSRASAAVGATSFECRFAGAAANSVEQKVSDLRVGPGAARVELGTAMLAQGRLGDAEHARKVGLETPSTRAMSASGMP